MYEIKIVKMFLDWGPRQLDQSWNKATERGHPHGRLEHLFNDVVGFFPPGFYLFQSKGCLIPVLLIYYK